MSHQLKGGRMLTHIQEVLQSVELLLIRSRNRSSRHQHGRTPGFSNPAHDHAPDDPTRYIDEFGLAHTISGPLSYSVARQQQQQQHQQHQQQQQQQQQQHQRIPSGQSPYGEDGPGGTGSPMSSPSVGLHGSASSGRLNRCGLHVTVVYCRKLLFVLFVAAASLFNTFSMRLILCSPAST